MRRLARVALTVIELVLLSAVILAARCANYADVFVTGNVYFTDADCYARMTRARMCAEHPGLIIRHHDFENFPEGTTPHTTAPLDYLIVGLSILLRPFTAHVLDLAGALVSPLLAIFGGWFLWWWSRRINLRYRWILLLLYAISPVLVHATKLGRPDHQSLAVLLVVVAVCAEWTLRFEPSTRWSIVSGAAWAFGCWVSLYEPLLLLALVVLLMLLRQKDRQSLWTKHRRTGWIVFVVVLAVALLIERRLPRVSPFYSGSTFRNWSRAVTELVAVSPTHPIWFQWVGWSLIAAPVLLWLSFRRKTGPPFFVSVLLVVTYLLTIWQARWGYFFAAIFALALPALLDLFKSRALVLFVFIISLFPVLRDWDGRLWPNEAEYAERIQKRIESVQLHDLALDLQSAEPRAFLAQWWLSPQIAYWSRQPAVAGSSHEGLPGIAESARFFVSQDWQTARQVLQNHSVTWLIIYDPERATANSAAILGLATPQMPVCVILDRTPSRAPSFLSLAAQTGAGKLYRVVSNR